MTAMIWILLSFLALIPLGILVLIIALIVRKTGKGEEFTRKIRAVYMYTVMVISLIIMITGLVTTWTSTVDLILPDDFGIYNSAARGLMTSIATVAIGGAVFVYHGKKVKE